MPVEREGGRESRTRSLSEPFVYGSVTGTTPTTVDGMGAPSGAAVGLPIQTRRRADGGLP